MSDKKIAQWVNLLVQNERLFTSICKIDVHGQTNKSDGLLGNIYFISVTGKTIEGYNKSVDLVIKSSKENKVLREQIPIKESFLKEIFIYDRVVKIFDSFQKDNQSKNLLDFLPHFYTFQTTESSEVLIFENLRTQGYYLWDKQKPMTYEQIKLILQAYGKWHAFSFALRKHKKEIFEKLIEGNINMYSYFVLKVEMVDVFLDIFEKSRDACISSNETELLEKLQFSKNDATFNFTGLFLEDPEYHVIVHGDGWNNNFMFKSQGDIRKPTDVQIIDWQCAGVASPVMDLSHFIYACCDTGKYRNVDDLLTIYYDSLRTSLTCLSCDPEEVFPYNKLNEHWKKFSRYGLLIQSFGLKLSMLESNDAPDFVEAAEEGKEFLDNFNVELANAEEYYTRIRNNLVHYVENLK